MQSKNLLSNVVKSTGIRFTFKQVLKQSSACDSRPTLPQIGSGVLMVLVVLAEQLDMLVCGCI